MRQSITLQTNNSAVVAGDILGRLSFAASNESDGSESRWIAASIFAEASGAFLVSENPTNLVLATSNTDGVTPRLRVSNLGHFLPYVNNTYDLGSSTFKYRAAYATTGVLDYTGINTASPIARLHIETGSAAISGILVRGAPTQTADLFQAQNTSSGVLTRITSNGSISGVASGIFMQRLGVATSAPTQALHVAGNARITGALFDSLNTPGVSGQVLVSTSGGVEWRTSSGGTIDGTGSANYLARWIDADTLGTGVVFDNGTNVGIRTTSPSTTLDVRGSGYFSDSIRTSGTVVFASGNTGTVGVMQWNNGEGTVQLGLKGGNVTANLAQDNVVLCYNGTGSSLAKGQVVYVSGAQGQRPSVNLALATSDLTSARTIGLVDESIGIGAEGFVATFGVVTNLNTAAFTAGSGLWLSATTPGAITMTRPVAPNHGVFLGWCLNSHASAGRIFVEVQNGVELEEIHDVLIQSVASGNLLQYDSSLGVWRNTNSIPVTVDDSTNNTHFPLFANASGSVSPEISSRLTYRPSGGRFGINSPDFNDNKSILTVINNDKLNFDDVQTHSIVSRLVNNYGETKTGLAIDINHLDTGSPLAFNVSGLVINTPSAGYYNYGLVVNNQGGGVEDPMVPGSPAGDPNNAAIKLLTTSNSYAETSVGIYNDVLHTAIGDNTSKNIFGLLSTVYDTIEYSALNWNGICSIYGISNSVSLTHNDTNARTIYGIFNTLNIPSTGSGTSYGFYQNGNVNYGLYLLGEQKNYISNKIGINWTDPNAMLHAKTTSASTTGIIIEAFNSQTADLLQAWNSSAEVLLRINSAGSISGVASGIFMQRIGAGTNSPTQSLHVAGNARLTGSLFDSLNLPGNSGQIFVSTSGATQWRDTSSIGLVSATGVANKVAFFSSASSLSSNNNFHWDDTNARLAIGKTSAQAKLDVLLTGATTTTTTGVFLNNNSTSSTNSINRLGLWVACTGAWTGTATNVQGITSRSSGGTNTYGINILASGSSANLYGFRSEVELAATETLAAGNWIFVHNDGANVTNNRTYYGSYINISDSEATATDITSYGNYITATFSAGTSSGNKYGVFTNLSVPVASSGYGYYLQGLNIDYGLYISNETQNYLSSRLGINQTSPTAMLHLQPTSATVTGVIIRGAASQTADLLQVQNSSSTLLLDIDAAGSISGVGSGIFMQRVGVATSTPTQALHVAGNARITGAYYDSNNLPGTSGQVLTSIPNGTEWRTSTSSGSSNWSRKTTTYTAVNGDRIIADTAGGAWTLTLPASPSVGHYVEITDGANFATTNLTVARNGSTIEGFSDDVLLTISGTTYYFIYDGTTWEVSATTGKKGQDGITPSGVAGRVVFYGSNGLASGDSAFLWNSTTDRLSVSGAIETNDLDIKARYTESFDNIAISSNTLTINLASGNLFTCSLNANINTMTVTNVPSGVGVGFTLIFTADGTLRTVSWPSGTKWPGGTGPTLTSTNGKQDVFSLLTTNSGVNWFGFIGGQNF